MMPIRACRSGWPATPFIATFGKRRESIDILAVLTSRTNHIPGYPSRQRCTSVQVYTTTPSGCTSTARQSNPKEAPLHLRLQGRWPGSWTGGWTALGLQEGPLNTGPRERQDERRDNTVSPYRVNGLRIVLAALFLSRPKLPGLLQLDGQIIPCHIRAPWELRCRHI